MKGRIIALGEYENQKAAALIVDGVVEDILLESKDDVPLPGTIYRAIVDRPLKGMGGATVKLPDGSGFLRNVKGLKPGQSLLVQVTSIAEPGKAVPLTDRILFKGRAGIVTPSAPGLNISRQIRDDDDRLRLHDLATDACGDRPWGMIVRSVAVNLDDDEIVQELGDLVSLADQVMADNGTEPELLVSGPDVHELAWRDWADPIPDAIETEGFDDLGVPDEIEKAMGALEPIAGGGFMYVEPTRAFVAVDVNTGTDTSQGAGIKANVAAAKALPRALRIRGLGGQIIVDFAPMPKSNRKQIEQTLRAAFKADSIETSLGGWTTLGNFELQRKRERSPLV